MLKYVTDMISSVINSKSTSATKQEQASPESEPHDQVIYEDAVEYMNCCPELSGFGPSLPSLPMPPPVEQKEHEPNHDETGDCYGPFQSMEEALGFSWPIIETPAGVDENEVSNESSNPKEEVGTEPIISSPSKSACSADRRSSLRILSKKCEITPAKLIKQHRGTCLKVKKRGPGRPPTGQIKYPPIYPMSKIQSAISKHDKGWSYRAIAKWVGPHCSSGTVHRWCTATAARLQLRSKRKLKTTKCIGIGSIKISNFLDFTSSSNMLESIKRMQMTIPLVRVDQKSIIQSKQSCRVIGSMKIINFLDFTSSSNILESFKRVQMTIPLVRIDQKSIIQGKQLKNITLPIPNKKRALTNHGGRPCFGVRRSYTKAQKKMAVSLLDKGVPCRRVAELVGIRCSSTPCRWRQQGLNI